MNWRRNEKAEKHNVLYPELKSKNLTCVQCKRQFSIKENNFLRKDSLIPLLLPCGHSVCDNCHQTVCNLSCKICEKPQLEMDKIKETKLPIDVYTIGAINVSQSRPMSRNDPDLDFHQTTNSKIRQSLAKGHCSECMSKAIIKCIECNVLLCISCHSKLHGRALGNHRKVIISHADNTIDVSTYTKCSKHNNLPFSIFCQVCNTVACAECLVKFHNGHSVDSLSARNKSLKEEFDGAYNKVAETLERVHHTQKKIQRHLVFPDQLQNCDFVEGSINRHFAQIHGVLQRIERDLIEEMNKQRSKLKEHLENLHGQLQNHEELLQDGLVMAATVKNFLNDIDLLSLITKLEDISNLPCHLIKETVVEDQRVRFEVDKTMFDVLNNHCKITVPDIVPFTLVKSENLPSNHILEPINQLHIPSLWEDNVRTRSVSPTSSIASTTPVVPTPGEPLGKGGHTMVKVTHISDPSCFYVQQKQCVNNIDIFHKKLKESALKGDKPKDILIDTLYIVKYENFWYRGRVKSINTNQNGENTYEVYYIDFGNSKTVGIQEIRYLPHHFSTQSSFAIKCCLYDISPKEEKWTSFTISTMRNLITQNSSALGMYVYDIVDNVYHVDIFKNNIEKQVSVRESLLWMGLGSFTTAKSLRKSNPSAVRKFFHQELKISKFTPVKCLYVESPDSIYVAKLNECAESFEELKNEMKKEYKKGKSKHLINSPEIGMSCAAQYSDNYWYRAVICDIPCIQTVELFFVDIGVKATMSFEKIRKIQQKFMILTTQAIHVSLKDVAPTPTGSTKWDMSAKEYLAAYLFSGKIKVFPYNENESNPFYRSYSVCLYLMDNTNINALLVSSKLAICTGISSQSILHNPEENEVVLPRRKKNVKASSSVHGGSSFSVSSKSEKFDEIDPYRFRVTVLNAKSPDCIYVADPTKEEMNSVLQAELQKFYNKHIAAISEIEWQKDQMCAVYSPKDKAFFRAKILDVISETELNVLLIDLGLEEIVSLDDVQPLEKAFLSTPRYQFKVKLADITAPGGSASWPSSSCQKLRDIINDNESHRFFLSKVEATVDEVIPVELWVRLTVTDGPLAPTKIEMKSVSRMLVETGYAIPIKGYSRDITRALAMEVKKQLNKSEQSSLCLNEVKWNERKTTPVIALNSDLPSTITDSTKSDSDTLSETESIEDLSSETVPMPTEISKWIPAPPIIQTSFRAVATYVDHNCFVYLHPIDKNETLKMIEAELDKRYCRRTVKAYDKIWKENDICIAQYHDNQKWYRAQIKKIIDSKNVQVEFVDYGNVEDCEIGTVKKRIILEDIPIQSTKCVVYGLNSNTHNWPTSYLDKIHFLLVDKEFEVNVLKRTGACPEILHISITLLRPKYCDLVTFVCKELGFIIENPTGSFSESEESPLYDSGRNLTVKKVDDEEDVADVLIEGFLNSCQANPDAGAEYETELVRTESIADETESIKAVSETAENEILSSIESLTWNNLVNNETRMVTSTPQVEYDISTNFEKIESDSAPENISSSIEDSSEENAERLFKDIVDSLKCDELIKIDMSSITKKGLKKMELEFLGHVTGGNEVVNKIVEIYNQMDKEIQETASYQPLIENPKINMPCYALYTDKKWYRGLIIKIEKDPIFRDLEIFVKYIDFGNISVTNVDELREMHQKWMNVPRMAVKCKVYNLVPKYDISKTEFARRVVLYYENKRLFAKIKGSNNRKITVDLFFDSKCTQPALLPLIKEGLFHTEV